MMYVNTTAEVKALTDYCCTSANAVDGRAPHLRHPRRRTPRSCSARTCGSGPTSRRSSAGACTCGTGSATSTPGIRPTDIDATRAAHPGADFLIHPECGCTTSVMEYVAAGDVAAEGVHMLSTGGMLQYARDAEPGRVRRTRTAAPTGSWTALAMRRIRPRLGPRGRRGDRDRACSTRCGWPRPT